MSRPSHLGARAFLGRGWAFPLRTTETGAIALSEGENDIKESIRIILATAPGERVMRPRFGCGIHDLVFESVDAVTIGRVESGVRQALVDFEPRIELLGVRAAVDELDRGRLVVSIDYRVRETNHEFNLVYPFYLKEGADRGGVVA
jgi:phage baseplate assembly protein W